MFASNLKFAFVSHVLATMFGAMPNGPVTAMIQNSVPRTLRVLAAAQLRNGRRHAVLAVGAVLLGAEAVRREDRARAIPGQHHGLERHPSHDLELVEQVDPWFRRHDTVAP